ncbi:MAG: DsbA family oxidoreductase [Gammaproteobacteria bacterium]|jgi:predicted DsbA family dithiol-disulfide isomerase
MNARRVLTIDLVSDLVSPWCYLAKRRLDRALGELEGASEPLVRWQPFEINPALPEAGMEVDRYLAQAFGSSEAGRSALGEVAAVGEEEGIRFKFDQLDLVPNTMNAHRLILLAEAEGRGDEMADTLFRGFFEEGQDIGRIAVLKALAARAGLDTDTAEAYLAGDRNRNLVRSREARVREAGLTGVPSVIVNGRLAISGVHEPEVLLQVIDRALFEDLPESPPANSLH